MSDTKHKRLYDLAEEAIDKLFSDTSVPPDKTAESLRNLREEIDAKLETLE